jgi:hydroxypyruvate isomerase
MPKFAANLSTLFQELPILERIGAASKAGFKAVELWFPYEIDAAEFKRSLEQHNVVCVGINSPAGNPANGDWGLAVEPLRRAQFEQSVHQAMAYAKAIDCPKVHVMAGLVPEGHSRIEAWDTYRQNIAKACEIAHDYGRVVLVEPLNSIDRPAYLLHRQRQAIELIKSLNEPDNLAIMVDIFHVQREQGNIVECLHETLPYAGHLQIADVPGRHEPGTGEINFPFVFGELQRAGYDGWIGCEYFPAKTTLDGLSWIEPLRRS